MESEDNSECNKKRCNASIRQMEIDDLGSVFHLGEKLFTASEVPNLYRTWDEYEVTSLFQGDREFCLVAEADDHLAGFALGTTVVKTRSAWKYGYLIWLGVDPAFHGQGLASRLFNRFRDMMISEGVRMLLVDTEADNLPALHFFRKMGFHCPQEHIYLSYNLDHHLKQLKGKKTNGRSGTRYKAHDDE